MLNFFMATGNIILGLLLFVLKFVGCLCGIALVLIVFLILFLTLVHFCVWIDQFLMEIRREKDDKL